MAKKQTWNNRSRANAPVGRQPSGKSDAQVAPDNISVGNPIKGNQQPTSRSSSGDETGHRWTFLTNHAHVLIALDGTPGLVLREVANQVGITERAVQRIIQDLEEEGFIRRHKVGRRNEYEVLVDQPLRHPLESHRDIGDLLRLVKD
jgi:DNA-binding HxlR family transcriptional regulator